MQKRSKTLIKVIVGVVALALVGIALGPLNQTLSVGTGYAAKRLCSEVYLADRDAEQVWKEDLLQLNFKSNKLSKLPEVQEGVAISQKFEKITLKGFNFYYKRKLPNRGELNFSYKKIYTLIL